jgi:hypothetical protein
VVAHGLEGFHQDHHKLEDAIAKDHADGTKHLFIQSQVNLADFFINNR